MSGPPVLRPALPRDEPFLRAVYASGRAWEFAATSWTEEEKEAFLRHQYDAQEKHYRSAYAGAEWSVITVDGADAGRLIVFRNGAAIEIMDIALLESWRGQGTGTAIVRGIMAEAAALGIPVRLWVENANPARGLYDRLNFRHVSDYGPHCEYVWTPD